MWSIQLSAVSVLIIVIANGVVMNIDGFPETEAHNGILIAHLPFGRPAATNACVTSLKNVTQLLMSPLFIQPEKDPERIVTYKKVAKLLILPLIVREKNTQNLEKCESVEFLRKIAKIFVSPLIIHPDIYKDEESKRVRSIQQTFELLMHPVIINPETISDYGKPENVQPFRQCYFNPVSCFKK